MVNLSHPFNCYSKMTIFNLNPSILSPTQTAKLTHVDYHLSGLDWFSVGDNLLEDIMLYGAYMKLSKFIILKVFCLDFSVIILLFLFCTFEYNKPSQWAFGNWELYSLTTVENLGYHENKSFMDVTRWFWRFICSKDTWDHRWCSCNLQKSRYFTRNIFVCLWFSISFLKSINHKWQMGRSGRVANGSTSVIFVKTCVGLTQNTFCLEFSVISELLFNWLNKMTREVICIKKIHHLSSYSRT